MKRNWLFILIFLLIVTPFVSFGKINPTRLTCEYMEKPSVVDVSLPRLAWVNTAGEGERGQRQTAWQVRVATSEKRLEQATFKVIKNGLFWIYV